MLFGLVKIHLKSLLLGKKLKINGLKGYIGTGSKIVTRNNATIELGKKNWISDYCAIVSTGKEIRTGDNCYFNSNVRIISMDQISIGDNCLFGPNVVIVDHNHNFEDKNKLICEQGYKTSPVEIGSNVWVSANCVITKGVKITDNVIVGAGSVVTKSITEEGVYVGIPVKKIKEL